ncbi:hypothetical protein Mp_1g13430 [Marchantia polymorpha subsp. ruderalis]|uniref:Uncharacterized protein n=2 Tax=Marchantia polymorpha TaxID=3197 RepID=A0AAF6APQ6_MARPO|nr:hypothetical protein MARPO_0019s0113 [Marchantia polymorpha]BBM98426.1 hypothetical protein Mp_1g13430 [Marchantia polymorpha subsp. ruderalis]|eukprot:PTQ44696.1 hypothetical protein MARPO_0019s0113 [Marchantia polymorpha]
MLTCGDGRRRINHMRQVDPSLARASVSGLRSVVSSRRPSGCCWPRTKPRAEPSRACQRSYSKSGAIPENLRHRTSGRRSSPGRGLIGRRGGFLTGEKLLTRDTAVDAFMIDLSRSISRSLDRSRSPTATIMPHHI